MPRRKEELHPGEYYHIYNRGAGRTRIFFTDDNYLFFLRRFREKVPLDIATVVCWALMPNHYHFLVRIESDQFSTAMQAFGTSYSKAINKRMERTGTLFESRFQSRQVDNDVYLRHLTRYIHLNPSSAGLVRSPADWQFSSYRDFIGLRNGTLAARQIVLQEFESIEKYRLFVETPCTASETSFDHLLFDES